ncbi:phosphoenolpyruvate--protein phosphotransferase [Negativibacillus massiliensis]|uniref:phosphoenolpyruvate--protein phosphotransferase n=1 Tax=Negativibacillus massiliensis TaxID=1871035 RepID=UPI002A827E62|nr:phosphoenolpyruvate--protein phosphotransferase [Negativibacillus massiliensis]MDY4047707.1 phosphoenolpyruvate--protein phosphotransferase [Negativibacillus massiliensis]
MLKGVGASSGIGIGTIVCIREESLDYSKVVFQGEAEEKARLKEAVDTFCKVTQEMAEDIRQRVGEKESEILSGQIMMLSDPFMTGQMEEMIASGSCAEAALDSVCQMYIEMFSNVDDELMRQRATDIRDIRTRMLRLLLGISSVDIASVPAGTVLAAKDLTPSMTVGLKKENIRAILTEIGGKTSHSAILARALEIPAVLGIPQVLDQVSDGQQAIVDGESGEVILSPDEDTLKRYTAQWKEQQEQKAMLSVYRDRKTQDADGRNYELYSNIGSVAEAQIALENGAEGIGLFRTEFLFMDRTAMPTEQEQYEAYKAVSDIMQGKEVIIRTLDVGGDKEISYLKMESEQNPFLGWRAIRYCLEESDLFKVQLRALLRAGAEHKNIKIMLPLVTGVQEIRAAKQLLEECKQELAAQGIAYDDNIQVGIMIETPAAALIADLLAKEAAFFSIGTNDLTQYTLAVDRGNAKVENLYTTLHPAVLRSIRSIIRAAKEAKIPVGMCGEAAADPALIPLLLEFGLDEMSVSASSILKTRKIVSQWSQKETAEVEQKAMQLDEPQAVEEYLLSVCKR